MITINPNATWTFVPKSEREAQSADRPADAPPLPPPPTFILGPLTALDKFELVERRATMAWEAARRALRGWKNVPDPEDRSKTVEYVAEDGTARASVESMAYLPFGVVNEIAVEVFEREKTTKETVGKS